MFSPTKMLQQAKKMQEDMQNLQNSLKDKTFEISKAGGAVKLSANGQGDFLKLHLDPEFLKEEASMVTDTILSAFQEASQTAKATAQDAMKGISSGLKIPGMPSLF